MSTNPLESAVERIAATLRSELDAVLKTQAAHFAERAAGEREAAVRQAQESARQEAQQQVLQAQQAGESRVAGLRRELEQVRQTALEQVDSTRRALQAEVTARSRAEAQVEDVRRIGRTQVEEAQRTMTERISALTRDLDQARREVADRRQELDSAHGVSAAALHELVRGLHAVDESDSLTGVFERLIEAARGHSNGASVYLVRHDELSVWGSDGIDPNAQRAESAAAVASNAARERRRVESATALAFPLSVGGEAVADGCSSTGAGTVTSAAALLGLVALVRRRRR